MVSDPAGESVLERSRAAAARGEWGEAFALLGEADSRAALRGADLGLLADVAYAAGRLDVTIDAWERAYAEGLRGGDRPAAAGAALRIAMHLLMDTALMAPIRGWLGRADALLEGLDETPVHAWLAVVHNYERLLSGDFETARTWARRAIEVGSRLEPAAAAVARVAEARSLILDGDVRQGLALLDEAGVAAVSGELDPIATGVVYCELLCALQGLAQYDQADQWSEAMERWSRASAIGSFHGRCRVHRAEILRLRGACREAESEALLACDELRPYLRREFGWPLTELGRIRLQRGDLEGAEEAFVAAHQAGWDPHPGLALVRLARGDVEHAAAAIRDALERPSYVPSKEFPPNSDLRRAPLLAAQVEIGIAAGQLDVARAAAGELGRIATRFESKALAATTAVALGTVLLAEGDPAGARRQLDQAAHLWSEVGAPYEAANARLRLADAYDAEDNHDRALLERGAAHAVLEQIGARDAASRRPDDSGDRRAIEAAMPASSVGVFRREGDYWSIGFEDRTVRVRDLKGMRYLVRLLAEPGRELHVVDLVIAEGGAAWTDAGDAGEVLDARAREVYRRRLTEIDDDLEQARAMSDLGRTGQAEAERECLVRELSRAVGLDGRERRVGSASERARASVTRAIRQAMARIGEHHRPLAAHLDRAIRTGVYCVYRPDPRAPVAWRF